MRMLAFAAAALVALLPTVAADPVSDIVPASCSASLNEEGRSGAGCGLHADCYSVMWGYHTEFLTVGGGSSCSGGVWVNPDEQPEDPTTLLPGTLQDGLCGATANLC